MSYGLVSNRDRRGGGSVNGRGVTGATKTKMPLAHKIV